MTQAVDHRRQYERHAIDVRVQLVISDGHLTQVSPMAGPALTARMKNISAGGALIVVPTYLPRGTQIELEIPTGSAVPAGRVTARVTKVQMVDREPHYGVGLRFEDAKCALVQALRAWDEEGAKA
jgi:hypothetical protein